MMKRDFCGGVILTIALATSMLAQSALAQPGGGRGGGFGGRGFGGFGGGATQPVLLATLEQVQEALKLDDGAKQKVADLNQEMNEERRAIFQDAQGDFQATREDMAKLNADISKQLAAALNEEQQKRLQQIYIQVNGALALGDKAIAEALKMTEEQQADFTEALAETRQQRGGFGGGQNLTPEERAERRAERAAERDKALLAVLSEDQQKQFEEMKGEKVEIDTTALFGRGRGGRGRGLGGGRRNQP